MKRAYSWISAITFVVLSVAVPGCWDPIGCSIDWDSNAEPWDDELCYQGTMVIHDEDDVERFERYPCVDGGLVVESSDLVTLSLPHLSRVGTYVAVRANPYLIELDLPVLSMVEGNISIREHPSLTSVNLSALDILGSDLVFADNAHLANVSVATLDSVEGSLVVEDNHSMIDLYWLYGLESVRTLRVYDNVSLPDCAVCDLLEQLDEWPDTILVTNNLDDECTPVPAGCEEPDTDTGSDTDTETDTETDTATD
jgi:hypothetical protein